MRAALCRAYGPPEVVTVEDVDAPAAGPGQVRVRVVAASVNFPDVLIVANRYQISAPTPFVPGSEFAGVVEEVAGDAAGDAVGEAAGVAVGDLVTGAMLVGAFAEEVVVAAGTLQRVPDGVDARAAAAFGVAYRTAFHALRSVARLQPGDELVVLGAGGGVGLAAVQLGTLLGASVTAVASSAEKLEAAASFGATHLVDRRTADVREALRAALPEGADVVIDPVGGGLSEVALRAMRRGGRFVTVGYASGEIPRIPLNLVLLKGVEVHGFEFLSFSLHRSDEFRRNEEEIGALLAARRVTPYIGSVFPLEDAAKALRLVADGQAVGKVVVDVTPTA